MKLLGSCELLNSVVILTLIQLASSVRLFDHAFEHLNDEYRKSTDVQPWSRITQSKILSEKAEVLAAIDPLEWKDIDSKKGTIAFWCLENFEQLEPDADAVVASFFEELAKLIGMEPMFSTDETIEDELEIYTDTNDRTQKVIYVTGLKIQGGDQGVVLLGKEKGKDDLVVVKKPINKEMVENLRKEAEAMRCIGPHPGIVRLLDAGTSEDNKQYFVVFELMRADLFQIIKLRGKCVDLKTSVLIAKRMLEAVSHIHSKHYIHRDIKVENLMYSLEDGKVRVKLIDFGLAERYRGDDGVRFPEREGDRLGTLETMSMFVHRGAGPSPRDDVWGVFSTFVLLLTGSWPWSNICGEYKKFMAEKGDQWTAANVQKFYRIHNQIANTKRDESEKLAHRFPELLQFVNHMNNLEFNGDVDFDLLQNSLDALLRKKQILDDGHLDWDDGMRMLLQNPYALKAGVGLHHSDDGWATVILIERFYASIEAEIREHNCKIQVLTELHNVAMENCYNKQTQTDSRMFFEAYCHENDIENLTLSQFDQQETLTNLLANTWLYCGFGHLLMNNLQLKITMVLEPLVIDDRIKPQVLLMEHMGINLTTNKGLYLKAKSLDYTIKHVSNGLICHTEILDVLDQKSLTEFNMLHNTVKRMNIDDINLINNYDAWEYGFAWKIVDAPEANEASRIETYVAFRQEHNSLQPLQQRFFAGHPMLVWCSDESSYATTPASSDQISSSSSKIGKLKNQSNRNNAETVVIAKEIQTEQSSCESAIAWATALAIKEKMLVDLLWNVRIKWNMDASTGHYQVMLIQDSYYADAVKIYCANQFANNLKEYQFNWKITEAGRELNQLANSEALKTELEEKDKIIQFQKTPSLICFGLETSIKSAETLGKRISINMESLHANDSNIELGEFNPHDIATVSYGYHVTARGSVKGFSIYETYCHDALNLINRKRKVHKLMPLELSETNFTDAETFRKEYIGSSRTVVKKLFCSGSPTTDNTPTVGVSKFSSKKATTKEALSSFVRKFLKNEKGAEYEKVMDSGKNKISLAVFQSKKGGKWKAKIEVF